MAPTADTHFRVMTWARALVVQIDRLHAARLNFVGVWDSLRSDRAAHLTHEHIAVGRMLTSEGHLTMVAANQLRKALKGFDGDLRLTPGVTARHVRDLRDALEHWDDGKGRAQRQLAKHGADVASNRWRKDGSGLLADIVDDGALRAWAQHVYDDLVDFDPASEAVLI